VLNPNYKTVFDGAILYDAQVPKETNISSAWTTQVATEEEFNKIRELLEEGLKQGAIGVGHAPGYMVAGVTQQESNAAQELAAKYGRTVFLHGRYSSQMPPTSGLLGMAELMAPQAAYGGGLVVQHLHAQMLDLTPKALELVDAARKSGIKVIAEIYPYDYGATIVGADYLVPDNYQPNMGRDYKDIIETATMKPLTKERYEELKKTAPLTSVMFYNAREQTVYDALAHPGTVIGSDAFAYTLKATGGPAVDWDTPFDAVLGHPRGAGAHARFLRLVREKKVGIPLIDAVSKMTFLIADFLAGNGVDQMAKKGRVQVGCDADLVVFDPAEVRDNATMEQGALPSSGIHWVLVNGTVVVKESKTLKGVNPGKPIRCDRP